MVNNVSKYYAKINCFLHLLPSSSNPIILTSSNGRICCLLYCKYKKTCLAIPVDIRLGKSSLSCKPVLSS